MKRIAILGSTGSIGKSALDVVRRFPDKFKVTALSTNSNVGLLNSQIREFKPLFVCVKEEKAAKELKLVLKREVRLFIGDSGLEELVSQSSIEQVLMAVSGFGALAPLLKAIESGKDIALANKEALVVAGALVVQKANKRKIKILPVDSEQSAIWQCLEGHASSRIKTIYLTASGGPFRKSGMSVLKNITVEKVLRHPRWKMGKKITVDSATLMNKGLELLEAMFLFNMEREKIKIVIHPEAIIHSMVEFEDGIVLAQLSATDMRIPIQYALTYPQRLKNYFPKIDFYKLRSLNFERPEINKFPCLRLAMRAARELGTMPAVLNASNEVSVEEFLKKNVRFISIPEIIEKVMDRHRNIKKFDLADIKEADSWARQEANRIIRNMN